MNVAIKRNVVLSLINTTESSTNIDTHHQDNFKTRSDIIANNTK
jgi:hypothetical protein